MNFDFKKVGKQFVGTHIDDTKKWTLINVDQPNKPEVMSAVFDGYNFGGRTLEGVYFTVHPTEKNNGFMVVSEEDSFDYLDRLNMEHWMREAVEFARDRDEFTLNVDSNDVVIWSWVDDIIVDAEPVEIGTVDVSTLFGNVLNQLKDMSEPDDDDDYVTELNAQVLSFTAQITAEQEERVEGLAMMIAQAERFYYEGEDTPMTPEDFMKLDAVEKHRWVAKYVFKKLGML